MAMQRIVTVRNMFLNLPLMSTTFALSTILFRYGGCFKKFGSS